MASSPAPAASSSAPAASAAAMLARTIASLSAVSAKLSSSVPALSPHTESAKTQASALWTSAKPWADFFNGKKFTAPASATELQERLMDNITHFSPNYLICFLVLSAMSVLVHPLSFLCVLILAALYVYMFMQMPDGGKVGSMRMSPNVKRGVFGVTAFGLLYATNAIGIIGSWALFGIFLSLVHAGGRVSAKEPDFESPVNSV